MERKLLLEVCAFNIQSCYIAEKAGAGRIEFCADPAQSGITTSYGAILHALRHLSIPVFPMIGTRGGDYVFDAIELDIIKKDIVACRDMGCLGIATGIRLPNGKIDTETMKRIVELAYPMAVTCHKAFDTTPDAFEALEAIIDAGCARVLTSGLQPNAKAGAAMLAQLVKLAAGRIVIMPGGSIRSGNIGQLIDDTGAAEFHSSGIITNDNRYTADETEVRKMVAVLGG